MSTRRLAALPSRRARTIPRPRLDDVKLLLLPPLVYLLLLFAYPIVQWLSRGFFDPGPTLRHLRHLIENPVYLRVLGNTITTSFVVMLLSLLLGYPVAYYLASLPPARRNFVLILVLVPFWTGFLVRSFAWILLLQYSGIINRGARALGLIDEPLPLMYNTFGVTVGMVHVLMPYAILSMLVVMQGIDRDLVLAASTLGARPWPAFVRIFLPLSLSGVAASALLVFIMALGFFITPALLGGPDDAMISQSIQQQISLTLNWGFAALLALTLLAATLAIYWLYARTVGLETLWGTVATGERTVPPSEIAGTGQGGTPGPLAAAARQIGPPLAKAAKRTSGALAALAARLPTGGRWATPFLAWAPKLLAWAVLAYLMLPILFVIPMSFNPTEFLEFPPTGFSLRWYRQYFQDPTWTSATIRSLQVGVLAALISTVLGTMAAFGLVRANVRFKMALVAFLLAPMIVPRIVIAVAVFYLYSRLHLVGTITGLVLSHVVIAMPLVVISVSSVLQGFDIRLEHAALTLGAARWQTFCYVVFPLILPGILSGALFAFITSFDELIIALFVTSGLFRTLPKKMWDDIFLQVTPALAAVSTILIAVTVAVLVPAVLIRARKLDRKPN